MTKKMRDLQAQILALKDDVKGYMAEGEGRDLDKAEEALNKIDDLQKEYDLEARAEAIGKASVPADVEPAGKADGFKALSKLMNKKPLDESEKALISGNDATSGENYLIPEDVRVAINELRKTYVIRSLIYGAALMMDNGEMPYNKESMERVKAAIAREFDLP